MKKINLVIQSIYPEAAKAAWTVAEPFTGGGGSLINMAQDFPDWTFHLNDMNKEIIGIWNLMKSGKQSDFLELYEKINATKMHAARDSALLSPEQKTESLLTYDEVFQSSPRSNVDRAYKAIFLNKTSFNGFVTRSVPIGGREQKSKYPVGIYWNPKDIIKKTEKARKLLEGRILSVNKEDFEVFLKKTPSDFVYADPPYITYGKEWYGCDFDLNRLSHLHTYLRSQQRWCVSLDKIETTLEIFSQDRIEEIAINHTAKSCYKRKREQQTIASANELVIFPK